MAVSLKQIIAPQQLTNADAVYYTVPANTATTIKKLTITNNDTNPHTASVKFSGTNDAHTLRKTRALTAGECWEVFEAEGHILPAAATIDLVADANSVLTVIGSGVETV